MSVLISAAEWHDKVADSVICNTHSFVVLAGPDSLEREVPCIF
jgi:hypothetical protein